MDESRRDFITRGATLAAGTLLAAETRAAAAAEGAPPMQKITAGKDLRLATFEPAAGAGARVGAVLADGRVVDLGAEARRQGVELGFDASRMRALIEAGAPALERVRALLERANGDYPQHSAVQLLAPIPDPARNVYAVGWNYLEHFKEGEAMRDAGAKYPEHPVFFSKASHCVNGPFAPIPFDPAVSSMIDWEGELAVIIGKRGRNIPEAQALDHVFGFAVINDTTARDVQQKRHGGQWFKGKSLDGHGPMGPWIVTRGELDYNNLHLVTRVNGVVKQDANTGQMFFKVPKIIQELSLGLTLEPGDIIATGTPPGIGAARKPPEFMKPGDVMETEISGIGVIRNVIRSV